MMTDEVLAWRPEDIRNESYGQGFDSGSETTENGLQQSMLQAGIDPALVRRAIEIYHESLNMERRNEPSSEPRTASAEDTH